MNGLDRTPADNKRRKHWFGPVMGPNFCVGKARSYVLPDIRTAWRFAVVWVSLDFKPVRSDGRIPMKVAGGRWLGIERVFRER